MTYTFRDMNGPTMVQSFTQEVRRDGVLIGIVRCKALRPIAVEGFAEGSHKRPKGEDAAPLLSDLLADVLDIQVNEAEWYAFKSRYELVGLYPNRQSAADALASGAGA